MKKKGGLEFILDSGCTQYITNNFENFTTVMLIDPIRVHLADNRVEEARYRGKVTIDLSIYNNGSIGVKRLVLSKVLYIPDVSVSIIHALN